MTLTDKELKLINSKDGLMALLNQEELDGEKATRLVKYENRLAKLHEELIKLHNWVVNNNGERLDAGAESCHFLSPGGPGCKEGKDAILVGNIVGSPRGGFEVRL